MASFHLNCCKICNSCQPYFSHKGTKDTKGNCSISTLFFGIVFLNVPSSILAMHCGHVFGKFIGQAFELSRNFNDGKAYPYHKNKQENQNTEIN